MERFDIPSLRLNNHHLIKPDFKEPEDVVAYYGAIQAQDFTAANWSIGLRMRHANDDSIERAFNEGRFLRTHVMRPTWHFVMPEDIRWMIGLTAPRVKKILAPYDRRLEIDARLLTRCRKVIENALSGGQNLTRAEIGKSFGEHGIPAAGQRLGHIMAYMELDGLVCSGPRRGKQMTYALLEERVPAAKSLTREQALAKLASKYFTSHGPAQLKDFAWWSGLPVKDAADGVESIKAQLMTEKVEDKTYLFKPPENQDQYKSPKALLLSIYDEYTIAYKDRSELSERRQKDIEVMLSMGNALTSVIILNGKLAGTWKKKLAGAGLEITLNPFRELSEEEAQALRAQAARYGRFFGLPVTVTGI